MLGRACFSRSHVVHPPTTCPSVLLPAQRASYLTRRRARTQAFIYALCQMAVRQNIVKFLDLGPSRRMQEMQMPVVPGDTPK